MKKNMFVFSLVLLSILVFNFSLVLGEGCTVIDVRSFNADETWLIRAVCGVEPEFFLADNYGNELNFASVETYSDELTMAVLPDDLPPGTYHVLVRGSDGSVAEYFGKTKTYESGPTPISTCEELQNINNDLSGKYVLTNDIDCSDTVNWNGGEGFEPLGNKLSPFTGQLDGQGKKIINLYINRVLNGATVQTDIGLFGYVAGWIPSDTEIKDVVLEGGSITGGSIVGSLIGYLGEPATISGCSSSAEVTAHYGIAGGMFGKIAHSVPDWIRISDCHATGNVVGVGVIGKYGGLVGSVIGGLVFVEDSTATGIVNAPDADQVGGFVGFCSMGSMITHCSATGEVIGSDIVGGFVGNANNCLISSTSAEGDVSTEGYGGGLAGNAVDGSMYASYASGSVAAPLPDPNNPLNGYIGGLVGNSHSVYYEDCFATGELTGGSLQAGLIAMSNYDILDPVSDVFTACMWDTDTTGTTEGIGNILDPEEVEGKTTLEMMDPQTYLDQTYDLKIIWNVDGLDYPSLQKEFAFKIEYEEDGRNGKPDVHDLWLDEDLGIDYYEDRHLEGYYGVEITRDIVAGGDTTIEVKQLDGSWVNYTTNTILVEDGYYDVWESWKPVLLIDALVSNLNFVPGYECPCPFPPCLPCPIPLPTPHLIEDRMITVSGGVGQETIRIESGDGNVVEMVIQNGCSERQYLELMEDFFRSKLMNTEGQVTKVVTCNSDNIQQVISFAPPSEVLKPVIVQTVYAGMSIEKAGDLGGIAVGKAPKQYNSFVETKIGEPDLPYIMESWYFGDQPIEDPYSLSYEDAISKGYLELTPDAELYLAPLVDSFIFSPLEYVPNKVFKVEWGGQFFYGGYGGLGVDVMTDYSDLEGIEPKIVVQSEFPAFEQILLPEYNIEVDEAPFLSEILKMVPNIESGNFELGILTVVEPIPTAPIPTLPTLPSPTTPTPGSIYEGMYGGLYGSGYMSDYGSLYGGNLGDTGLYGSSYEDPLDGQLGIEYVVNIPNTDMEIGGSIGSWNELSIATAVGSLLSLSELSEYSTPIVTDAFVTLDGGMAVSYEGDMLVGLELDSTVFTGPVIPFDSKTSVISGIITSITPVADLDMLATEMLIGVANSDRLSVTYDLNADGTIDLTVNLLQSVVDELVDIGAGAVIADIAGLSESLVQVADTVEISVDETEEVVVELFSNEQPVSDPITETLIEELVEESMPPEPDADGDGVLDEVDKCEFTVAPESVPTNSLKPNHYALLNNDWVFDTESGDSEYTIADTFGCSCEQILFCKPGENKGEYKFGCTAGTMDVWMTQSGWSLDCQVNGIVTEGEAKDSLEDTDGDGIIDALDGDDDNDGVLDDVESEEDSASNNGKPDWWCAEHPNKC